MGKYQRQAEEDTANFENNDAPILNIPSTPEKPRRCFADSFKVLVIGIVIFSAAVSIGLVVDIYFLRKPMRSNVAITSEGECSNVASAILESKGNAVDAAVAAMMCLSVIAPDRCSLASAGYMLVHGKDKDSTLDFQFAAPNAGLKGSKSSKEVAIPGLLVGLRAAHKKLGKLPFEDLIRPSIKLASSGFKVSNTTASNLKTLPKDMQKHFLVDGKIAKDGDTLKLGKLSETLTLLLAGNYSLSKDIAETLSARNVSILLDDFEAYKPLWKEPLIKKYRGHNIITTDLPSSGVLLLSAVNILNQFSKSNYPTTYLRVAEVLKLILPKHLLLQDPNFDKNQSGISAELLSEENAKEYASQILEIIKSKKLSMKTDNEEKMKPQSTASASIMDKSGMVVSVVSTLGGIFGSKVMTNSGVILNNGMSLFSKSGKVNMAEPMKRPFSFASPAIVSFEQRMGVFNPSADQQGLSSLIQVLNSIVMEGKEVKTAVDEPRLFYDSSTGDLDIEDSGFSKAEFQDSVKVLKSHFKKVVKSGPLGSVDVIYQAKKTLSIADPR